MNRQVLRVFTLIIVAQSVLINLSATAHIRELDNPEEQKRMLELAQQVSKDNGKQLLESYSTWDLGTLLRDMQQLADKGHKEAAERQGNKAFWENKYRIDDAKKFFQHAFVNQAKLPPKTSWIIYNPDWNPQLPKEINEQLAATHAGETQAISNQLCDLFAQSAGQAFTIEEQEQLRAAITIKIDKMVGDRDYQEAEAKKWQKLDNTADINALDTTITHIKELRHKRFISLFKKFCCICIAVGLYRYRKQIAHYLLTHNFIPKALIRARV